MTIFFLPLSSSSMCKRERILILPLPVSYMDSRLSTGMINPPVGKSGPLNILRSSPVVIEGLSIIATTASMLSAILWVGMLVARPTAIPFAPLTRRLGNLPGKIVGSSRLSSKLGVQDTVSLSRSRRSSRARGAIRASV